MPARWRTPTVIIVAGCLIGLVSFGLRSSLGLFTEPLDAVRGFDRETFAFAIAVQNLVWGSASRSPARSPTVTGRARARGRRRAVRARRDPDGRARPAHSPR